MSNVNMTINKTVLSELLNKIILKIPMTDHEKCIF